MAVKTQDRKTLNFTTIHKRISEQGKIISELAPEYSMTEEAFLQEMRSGLGPKVFAALKKTSEKNEKARERLKVSAEKKRKSRERLLEKQRDESVCQDSLDTKEQQANQTSLKDDNSKPAQEEHELEYFLLLKMEIEDIINQWDVAIESSRKRCLEKEEELRSLNRKLQQVQQELADSENVYQSNLKMRSEQDQKLHEIDIQIVKIMQKNIYLIAPGYHGEIPEYGRLISTEPIAGIENVEIQNGDLLFNDENLSDMMACGYYDVREYMRAIEFAKLCIAFMTEHSHCTILIDDEKISNVLKTQGLEI